VREIYRADDCSLSLTQIIQFVGLKTLYTQYTVCVSKGDPCVTAGQYATSIVNRCWSGFPCKWRYINVATFNL